MGAKQPNENQSNPIFYQDQKSTEDQVVHSTYNINENPNEIPSIQTGTEFMKIHKTTIKTVGSFPDRSWDRFLMDFGTILEAFWLQKSIKIAINFGIDFWKAPKVD